MLPDAIGNRDIVVRKRGGGIQEFKDTNRAADPLHFVLLHSRGTDGWSPDLKLERNVRVINDEAEDGEGDTQPKRLTANKFYKYRLMQRPGETNHFLLAGRLFQEFVCVNFAKSQQQLFNYLEMNQDKLRSEVYKNVADHISRNDVEKKDLGKQIILPASHIGSPRYMHARYQDAMAVVRKYGKPDLFITMT